MARRFYVDKQLNVNDYIIFDGEDYNHIMNVLRFKINDELIVCNGDGFDYYTKLIEISKKSCKFVVLSNKINESETKSQVDVFQALVKGEKFELISQKLTELGVNALIPFLSEFVQVKENTTRLNRLEKISIEAVKQCGRNRPLKISNILSFAQMLEKLQEYDLVIFAYEKSEKELNYDEIKNYYGKKVAIVVGSEGGFSSQEEEKIIQIKNTKEISLGKRILRAETANICLTSVVMCLLNEWR